MSGFTVVSAPGKVLVAGGYLVLDPVFKSLVVALSARIYTVLQPSSGIPSSSFSVTIKSPQFRDSHWVYACSIDENYKVLVKQISGISRNAFIQQTLEYIFAFLLPLNSADINIFIYSDNDYYSQNVPQDEDAYMHRKSLPKFSSFDRTLGQVSKTGLGSSAALVASLTGAMLTHFRREIDLKSEYGRRITYNCAQLAHCAAQGKIGSGFDIAAAIYGSCIYSTFSLPTFPSQELHGNQFAHQVKSTVNSIWNSKIDSMSLPRGVRVVMADVDAGTETPSMIKNVLAWKSKAGQTAETLWNKLGESNNQLVAAFGKLAKAGEEFPSVYNESVKELLEGKPVTNLPLNHLFGEIQKYFQNNRKYLRKMGELSGTPIEPPQQTSLLDSCEKVDGVIGCGIPGAGGLDAIFCVILEESNAEIELHSLWKNWKEISVMPLIAEGISSGIEAENSKAIAGIHGTQANPDFTRGFKIHEKCILRYYKAVLDMREEWDVEREI